MIRVLIVWGLSLALSNAIANPTVGEADADGDVTLLSSFAVSADQKDAFETEAMASARIAIARDSDMWLMYEELGEVENLSSARFFTVHFPHDIDELTEPSSATVELVSRLGRYRVHAELTRQVPDWCSTTSLDANKLQYAYGEYLWLRPFSLEIAGRVLARRGEILRSVYGTNSDGNAAMEGFVAMVAPFQVMQVLFSSEPDFEKATQLLRQDLKNGGFLEEWDSLGETLDSIVTNRQKRFGRYRPELSVDP